MFEKEKENDAKHCSSNQGFDLENRACFNNKSEDSRLNISE